MAENNVQAQKKQAIETATILKRLQDIDKEMREEFEKDPRAFGSVCQNVVGIIENRVLNDLKSACGEKVRFSLDVWAGRTIQLIAHAMFDSDYGVERKTVTVDLVKVKKKLVNDKYLICGLALDEPQSAKVKLMLDKNAR